MNPGDVIVFKKIKDTLDQIKKVYGNYGYINWSYIPEQSFDTAKKTMDFVFDFQPDKQFFVHRIFFEGNTKTRDKVMRREFALEEGQGLQHPAIGRLGSAAEPAWIFRKN